MIPQEQQSSVDSNPGSRTFDEFIALADAQNTLYQQNSDTATLDLAVRHYCAAFDLGPAPGTTVDCVLAYFRFHHARLLRKEKQGGTDDISMDKYLEKVLEFTPPTHLLRPVVLAMQATLYTERYQSSKDPADLDSGIEIFKTLLDTVPAAYPQRVHFLMQYGLALYTRHMALRDEHDLSLSIEQFGILLQNCPADLIIPARRSLAFALDSRYKLSHDINDIDLAVKAYADVVDAPQPPLEYLMTCAGYAGVLHARFSRGGDPNDLQVALRYMKIVVNRSPPNHRFYFHVRASYANLLIVSSERTVSTQHIDEAIECIRSGLAAGRSDDPKLPEMLGTLGQCLASRFTRSGNVTDLESAVENCYAALSSQSSLEPVIRAGNMNRIAFVLYTRFQLQGDEADATRAKAHFRTALDLCPPAHFTRIQILNNYARMLGRLGRDSSNLSDISLSIKFFLEALDLCYASARTIILTNLAIVLLYRYLQRNDPSDLDMAYHATKISLELQSDNHPGRGMTFLFQAKAVIAMFSPKPTLVDAEIVLDILHAAQDAFSSGNPLLVETYREFSNIHSLRYSITNDPVDLENAFKYRIAAVEYSNGGSQTRFEAALQWVESAEKFDHPSLLDAYKSAIRILDLHLILKPSLDSRHDIIKRQALTICADATSCALSRRDVIGAVELFEHSRGMFWTFMSRLRTSLDDLRASGPGGQDLSDEFEKLSRQLETPMTPMGDNGENGEGFRRAQRDWNAVVDKIRAIEGFDKFLLPPSYEDLQIAATGGPVIILNASRHSCDAVIVLVDADPIHVAFPEGTYCDITRMAIDFKAVRRFLHGCPVDPHNEERKTEERRLAALLRLLWNTIVGAVVRALEPHVPRNSRIWWCPTGVFTSLPIHAANPYRTGERGLSDLYVSSYTPTLSALIRSRKMRDATGGTPSFVSIGQPNPGNNNQLIAVRQELDQVRQLVPDAVQFTELVDEAATREAALTALSTHTYAHLACHGQQALGRPFDSYFAMHGDGHVTLLDIVQGHVGQATEFAFLSACMTATGDVNAPDEVIHLAAALQFAGVRNVVGTMWKVDDQFVVHTVDAFYRAMVGEDGVFDPMRAARALRLATRVTKDRVPLDQRIVFIHIGV